MARIDSRTLLPVSARLVGSVAEPARAPERKDTTSPQSTQITASAELVRRLQSREPEALEDLYEQMAGRAFGLAYRVLSDGPAAEDVVQEAFLWVWNNSDRIDPARGRVDALLLTVVHRRSIDALRARTRRDALGGEIDVNLVDEQASDLFAKVADSLTHEHVRACVESLTADQRNVIELAYFRGMTHQEIADEAGIPLGTVKSRMRLGMAKLRTAFGIGDPA